MGDTFYRDETKLKERPVEKARKEVLALLKKHRIPLATWGTGKAKTFDHLLREITSGEAELIESEHGLVRKARGAIVAVYYDDNGTRLFLEEDRQEFKDGRVRTRDLDTSIGEKLAPNEDAVMGARRALIEELDFPMHYVARLPLISEATRTKGPVPSDSYPGLMTLYIMYPFSVTIPPLLFKREGYKEKQKDKTSFFVWKKI
jgi:hypothetical protein